MPPITLAIYQGGHKRGVESNVQLAIDVIKAAAAKQVDLVVFCETFLHGYCSGELLREKAEIQQGPSFQAISKAAADNKVCMLRFTLNLCFLLFAALLFE